MGHDHRRLHIDENNHGKTSSGTRVVIGFCSLGSVVHADRVNGDGHPAMIRCSQIRNAETAR